MNQILCSTGAIVGRPNGRDITLLNQALERLGCDGYEFMMYDSWYDKLKDIRAFMRGFPAPVPVFHVEKTIGERLSRATDADTAQALRLFEINCELAKEIDARKLVLHLWNGVGSDRNISHNLHNFGLLRDISNRYDLLLTVENVVCERSDPLDHLTVLSQMYPDIRFTFDTKMAAFHGQLERLYEERSTPIRDRVCHLHINDYGGGYMEWARLRTLHIGDGHVDFDSFFAFLRQWGYSGAFTVESTAFRQNGSIDFEKLNQSILKIKHYLTTT